MLVAELKNEIVLKQQVNPILQEDRVVDSFYLIPLDYRLGGGKATFQVVFTKKEMLPANPASDIQGEEELLPNYVIKVIYHDKLNEGELELWGNDDTYLYEVFASRYNLEIASFVNQG